MKDLFKQTVSEIVEKSEKSVQEIPTEFTDVPISWKKFFISLALIAGLTIILYQNFGYMLPVQPDKGDVTYYIIMSIVISIWPASKSIKLKQTLKTIFLWCGVGLILMIGYSYRFEIKEIGERIIANLNPDHGIVAGKRSISFQISSNGHFYVVAHVNDQPMRFLVDTGASSIVFPPQLVKKLGYNLESLSFHQVLSTANGEGRGAPIQLDSIQIGGLHLNNMKAFVNKAEMDYPLLGMNFFKRLKSYKVEKNILTLSW